MIATSVLSAARMNVYFMLRACVRVGEFFSHGVAGNAGGYSQEFEGRADGCLELWIEITEGWAS